ncbi:GNAT family N-acetyltransferase [Alkalihalophilus pseudofirmus]|uniref:GNAT family N-acetyltransferase n=1 Tax=Alkalihalophilus pseudofirmus TaxID=79885 RepID=UPI00259B5468|nr:GNAT family N-acetyltransferase [Alkalihalophilus pseudofirmus]WEG16836.1 GNAT family N-acetyltransferase [Alkalihalophilus pseudofirmus]
MLGKKTLQDVKALQEEVEKHDEIKLKLNWDMLQKREEAQHDFFYYDKGELIAFVGTYRFGNKAEVCGMVKPTERRKGHATRLTLEAVAQLRAAGINHILLNAPAKSVSGQSFARSLPTAYSFSEHQMKWHPNKMKTAVTGDVTLLEASDTDLAYIIKMDALGFEMSETEAGSMYKSGVEEGTYIIYAGKDKAGKLRIVDEGNESWIYGFVVTPPLQGKGIGRSVLQQVVERESNKGRQVHLEVALENPRALKLYTSVGFIETGTQDYFLFKE